MYNSNEDYKVVVDTAEYVRLVHSEAALMAQVKALREALQPLAALKPCARLPDWRVVLMSGNRMEPITLVAADVNAAVAALEATKP